LKRFVTPQFTAQSQGVVIGAVVGCIACAITGLPGAAFLILTIVSMGLAGLVFTTQDAARANAGRPAVSIRCHFWRGLAEAAVGFALTLGFVAIRAAT
jgi:hypothetical protein